MVRRDPRSHSSDGRSRRASSRRKPGNAIDLLGDDHRRVEELFARFERAGRRAFVSKRSLVDAMINELSVHAAIEQSVLYPAARAAVPDSEADVLEALEEHHVVAWQLQELDGLDPEHERFDARVAVMIENVRQHQREEEELLFPELRTHLDGNRLVELGQELRDLRSSVPARPPTRGVRQPADYRLTDALVFALDMAKRLTRPGHG